MAIKQEHQEMKITFQKRKSQGNSTEHFELNSGYFMWICENN